MPHVRSQGSIAIGSAALVGVLVAGCGHKKDAAPQVGAQPSATPAPPSSGGGPAAAPAAATAPPAPASARAEATARPAAAVVACTLPVDGIVKTDLTVPTGCRLDIKSMMRIEDGATVAIQPGATLAFGSGAYLEVREGTLVAIGTDAQPVLFTSRAAIPHAGDWGGLVFRDRASGGNTLDHVIIEYAGRGTAEGPGSIVVHQDGPVVGLASTTIRRSLAPAIVFNGPTLRFTAFHDNTISDLAPGDTAMQIDADAMRDVGAGNHFGGDVHVRGDVTTSATWPAIDGRYVIEGRLRLVSPHNNVTLTLSPGAILAFNGDSSLDVGLEAGGGVIAHDVTFTSASVAPHAGDWAGLIVFEHATATTIDHCVFEYAGKPTGWGDGVIDFHDGKRADYASFQIVNTTFRSVQGPAIRSRDGDCGDLAEAASKNTIDRGTMCAKDGKGAS
jgi:hypothetical protein